MSTRTSLSRTSTTRPRTTSPSSTSLTPRLNQYSMLSSEASPSSFAAPTRPFDFLVSLSMTAPLLGSIYILSTAPSCRGRHPSRTSGPSLLLPELRDGAHHLLGRFTIRLLASLVTRSLAVSLEAQRWPEGHPHLAGPGQRSPAGQRGPAPRDVHRHHRRPAQHRQHPHPGPTFAGRLALHAPRALRKHQDRAALLQQCQRGLQRPRVRAVPAHRARVERPDQPPEERDAEQLLLGHEEDRPRHRAAHQRWVEHAHVIGHDQHRAGGGHELPAHRLQPEQEAHQHHRDRFYDRVQHLACSITRNSPSTTSATPRPVVSTTTAPSGFTSGASVRSMSWRSRRAMSSRTVSRSPARPRATRSSRRRRARVSSSASSRTLVRSSTACSAGPSSRATPASCTAHASPR